MARYRLVTEWETEAPITQVWDTIIRYDARPTWWRGVRAVTMLGGGDDSGVGSVLRQEWRALLPFPLVFDLEMVRIAVRACWRAAPVATSWGRARGP